MNLGVRAAVGARAAGVARGWRVDVATGRRVDVETGWRNGVAMATNQRQNAPWCSVAMVFYHKVSPKSYHKPKTPSL